MNKNLALIALFFLVASTTAQTNKSCDSTYNTLLKSSNNPYGPEGLSQPQNVTGLKYCQKQLEGKLSCCSADTINSLNNVAQQQVSAINQDAQKLDQSAITFVKAAAQIQLESSNYTAEVQKLNTTSQNSTRILLQVFQRILQLQQNGTQQPPQNGTQQQPIQNGTQQQQPMQNGTQGGQQQGGQQQGGQQQGGQQQGGQQQGGQQQGGQQQGGQQQGGQQQGQKPQAMNATQANQTKAVIMQGLLGQNNSQQGQQQGGQQQGGQQQGGQQQGGQQQGGQQQGGQQQGGQQQGGQQQGGQGQSQTPNLNQKPKAASVLENVQSQMNIQQPSEMKGLLQKAQQARAQCMKYLGKLKTQFACMACDYNNITAALSSGSLTLSNQICTDLQNECYDFANYNQNVSLMRNSDQMQQQLYSVQQQRLSLNQINNNITTMNQQLIEGGVNSTNQTIGQIQSGLSQLSTKQTVDNTTNSTFIAKSLPTSCKSKTDCTYLCSHIINIALGGIDFSRAQNPGENITVDASNATSTKQLSDKSLQPGGGNNMAPPQQPKQQGGQQQGGQQQGGQQQGGQQQGGQQQGSQNGTQMPQMNGTQPQQNGTQPPQNSTAPKRMLQLSTTATFSSSGVAPEDSGLSSVVETSVSTDPAGVSSTTVTASLDNIVASPTATTSSSNGSLFNFCVALFIGMIALLY